MKISVSPEWAEIGPDPFLSAADSRVRTTVVPTATIRGPQLRARFRASAVSGEML